MKLRRLNSSDVAFKEQLESLLANTDEPTAEISRVVESILVDVKTRGDAALLEYTNRFDDRDASIEDLEIPVAELEKALETIPAELRKGLEHAASRVRDYHERQKLESWSYKDKEGNTLGQQVTPLDRVGLYVPGGKAAYPTSVLMNAIPAHVAGVPEIIMVVPTPKGEANQMVLAAAAISGVNQVFSVGGAQAIAALAYGTASVPRVDKIVGPGNIYVATAKRRVFGIVGIDMIAGPSEVVVVSDGESNPDWVAMDLFAQAEHDEEACSILICPEVEFLDAVEESISRLLPEMERKDIIRSSLDKNGALILVEDIDEAIDLVNQIAPEHLELSVAAPEPLLPKIRHAGAIFMGHYAAEVLGDYCAGPNHVLPTARTARFSSPLGVYDFQKRSSVIMCTEQSASTLALTASVLAHGEGLTAHARAAEYRIRS
ncbi:MAG: histidinol dehydrogenase [Proteobacteria bacterium]|nr:histidinol dehydrogenase [Pseudomonadota bacterium]